MVDNVSFNQIPPNIRTNSVMIEIDPSKAVTGLPNQQRRILVIGQRFTSGTVAEAVPTRILNAAQAFEYFGEGSMLHQMAIALKANNSTTEVWAVALNENAAGVVATGAIQFSGAVTQAGTLNVYIAGHQVQIAVAAAEAAATTAANLVSAIAALSNLPVTAAVNGGDNSIVDLTCRWKGETGNDIDLRANYFQGEQLPKGLVVAITAMNGGTGNPDITTALAAVSGDQHQTIVNPFTDAANMTALESELSDRFGPLEQKWGHAFCAMRGTHAALSTYGDARNSAHSTVIGSKNSPTPPWQWAAALGAVVEFNGAIDPARPFQTLELRGVMAPLEADRFDRAERDLLLNDGISTFTVSVDGTVRIERVITTYQQNAAGADDTAFLDYNTVATVDYIRYAMANRIQLRYPRYKLADDGTRFAPGQAVVTPKIIRGELITLFRELEYAGLVENFDQFKQDLIVVRSTANPNQVNCVFPPDIINQFRQLAAALAFIV